MISGLYKLFVFSFIFKNLNYSVHVLSTGASCSIAKDGNNFSPQSLFLICLDFVAKNITMVESLAEFPDIVGKELFHKVQENEGFVSSPKNLKLFCEAYGELVLSKLSLSSKHILANNYLEFLQFFTFLTEMDVSHCRLGDTHELLSYMSHFHWWVCVCVKELVHYYFRTLSVKVTNSSYWMRLSRMWRIMQIEKDVIYRGWRPRW